MIRRLGLAVCLLASCLASGGSGIAFLQNQNPPVFRGGVNVVYVDVYPRRDGRVIEGLRAEDFQVLEDGKPQKVEAFEFIRIGPNAPDTDRRDPNTQEEGERLAADPHNRVFVVYLDRYHTTFAGAHETRRPLIDFLTRTIGPTDLFGVMSPETSPSQLVFGRRTDTLEAELTEHVDWYEAGRQSILPRNPFEFQLETCSTAQAPNLGDALVTLYREDLLMTNLEELMVRLRDLKDERKNLLLISEGWIPRPPQTSLTNHVSGSIPRIGQDPGTGRLGVGGRQGNMQDRTWCDQQIARLANVDFQQRFKDLLTLANRANVSFYPVDVGGLKTNLPDASMGGTPSAVGLLNAGRARGDTLLTLADSTDGRAIVNTNDLNAGFRKIADDLSAYYLLGYSSTNANVDGKFHRIDVKVSQPKVSLTARRGYLAPARDARPAATAAVPTGPPPALTNALARLSRLRSDADLFSYAVKRADGLDVVAEIASQEAGRWASGGDVKAVVTRANGENVTATTRVEAGARGALVHVPIPEADAGPWRVNIHVSTADHALDDRVDVANTSTALVGAPICYRGTASARIALRPVADFQFRRTERLHVEWPALKPLDERLARVLDRRGLPLALNATVTETASARDMISVDLTLAPLSEGDYVIELIAGAAKQTEKMLIAFRVVR